MIDFKEYEWDAELEAELLTQGIFGIKFDRQRHLVVEPYSKENLHRAAKVMGLKRCWFHKDHYDLPKTWAPKFNELLDDYAEQGIEGSFIERVSPREILRTIKGGK